MQTVRDVTYQLLREFGLTTIFGNVGSTEEPFLKNFPTDFRYVLALQEASVIGMADGFAQATGRPALVNVHTGAGLGNSLGNLITASLNKTPLIVTAGQQTREMLLMEPWLTNVEATMLPRPWVKWAYEPVRAEDVPAAFMRAIATALQPPAGPVFLSLPLDDWEKPCAGPAVVRTVSRRFAPDSARLAEFAKTLSEASSPVLIYGAAIDRGDGWSEAIALCRGARRAGLGCARLASARRFQKTIGSIRADCRSPSGRSARSSKATTWRSSSALPCSAITPMCPVRTYRTGCGFCTFPTIRQKPRAPLSATVCWGMPSCLSPPSRNCSASIKPKTDKARERMAHRMAPHPPSQAKGENGRPSDRRASLRRSQRNPARACRSGGRIAFESRPTFTSPGRSRNQATFFTFASGGLGWNLPASVGIALGERDTGRNRPVIMIIGDGSFQYSLQSIWTRGATPFADI